MSPIISVFFLPYQTCVPFCYYLYTWLHLPWRKVRFSVLFLNLGLSNIDPLAIKCIFLLQLVQSDNLQCNGNSG